MEIEKITLIGSSLGSIVATEYTLENAPKVEKLILASPGINGEQPNAREFTRHVNNYVKAMMANKYQEATNSLTRIAFTGPNRGLRDVDPELLEFVTNKINNHINRGFWKEPTYFLTPVSNSRLEEISTPTLLILGEEDYDYIHQNTTRLAEKISNVQLQYIENTAHLTNMEKPKSFNLLLESFINKR